MLTKENQKVDMKYNFKVYLGFVKKYKFLVAGLLLITLIMESTLAVEKFLFKIIIDRGTDFSKGILSSNTLVNIFIIVAVIFVSLFIMRSFLKWLHIHLINVLDSKIILDLKRKFFNHIIHLSHHFHTSHKTGSLISRLVRGAGSIERMTDAFIFHFIPLLFQLVIVGFSLLLFNWVPALVAVSTVIIFILYSILIQYMQEDYNLRANKQEDIEKANISDFFTNIDSIKYFGKENIIKNKFEKLANNTKSAFLKFWALYRWMDFGQNLILGIGTFFLIYFPLVDFLNNKTTIGSLVFIYTIYGTLISSVFGFFHGVRNFYRAMADFDDLFQYGKIENDIKEPSNGKELKITKGEVKFNNVSFSYGKRKIFEDFTLKMPKEKKIALVGHSGSGKSTLVKLLYRLYDVNFGEILIDNKDIRNFKQESLRSEMSIVPQECVLFDDTIYNNVAFSKPSASKEEIIKAMKFAQLDKIIAEFPNKENTIVGERGVKLSGGEKQRVSIARAILADKKILVLDEATSSLDSRTEYEIKKDLKKLMKGRTTIIIAHRLSTIMHADLIVVLKKGRIVQKGTHRQLIKKKGEYRSLWNLQKGGYIK